MDESGPGQPPTAGERAAVAVCAGCPMLDACRAAVLEMPLAYGVAGGLTTAQRAARGPTRPPDGGEGGMSMPVRETVDESGGELAVQLGRLAGVAQRLLVVHVPDPHGRCRGCTTAGTGLPGAVWPCALHFYASAAAARVVGE